MAEIPLFFYPEKLQTGQVLELPEDTAKHISQVLRMQAGEALQLCDGQGMQADCSILSALKKKVELRCEQVQEIPRPTPGLQLAIAFTKNTARNEWLLEKATEMGVQRITPLITERGNRERLRPERARAILLSALLQSRQYWLPVLDAATPFAELVSEQDAPRYIAHCLQAWPASSAPPEGDAILNRIPIGEALKKGQNACILIGPEGDFSPAELTLASAAHAQPVSIGSHRLRTETAALAALTCFYLLHHASAS